MKIIDNTLMRIWDLNVERFKNNIPKIRELADLLYEAGCNYIRVTPEIYKVLNVNNFFSNNKFYITECDEINIDYTNKLEESLVRNFARVDITNLIVSGLDDLMLYEYEEKFSTIKSVLGKDINMSIGNKYGCATALTLEWLRIGGSNVITSFAGIGGDAPLEEVICSLKLLYNINLSGKTEILPRIKKLFEEITERVIPINKPFIGEEIFSVESGVHVDGIIKNPKNFEPYEPYIVGKKRRIVIGKFSGLKAVNLKLNDLGIYCSKEDISSILEQVRYISSKEERALTDSELIKIAKEVINNKEEVKFMLII